MKVRKLLDRVCRLLAFLAGWWCIHHGVREGIWWYGVLGILIASPLLMSIESKVFEGRPLFRRILAFRRYHKAPAPLFDWQHASKQFVVGDPFVLTFAMAMMIIGQRHLVDGMGWHRSLWWLLLSVLIGWLAGSRFHMLDRKAYRMPQHEAASALASPTKKAHDFVTYSVLFGGLFYADIPLLVVCMARLLDMLGLWTPLAAAYTPAVRTYTLLALVGMGVWVALGILFDRKLDARKLHPAWDKRKYKAIPWTPRTPEEAR